MKLKYRRRKASAKQVLTFVDHPQVILNLDENSNGRTVEQQRRAIRSGAIKGYEISVYVPTEDFRELLALAETTGAQLRISKAPRNADQREALMAYLDGEEAFAEFCKKPGRVRQAVAV